MKDGDIYEGQTRYHGKLYKFKVIEYEKITFKNELKNIIKPFSHNLKLKTLEGNTMMVSGQTIVLYQRDIMIGGGIIS